MCKKRRLKSRRLVCLPALDSVNSPYFEGHKQQTDDTGITASRRTAHHAVWWLYAFDNFVSVLLSRNTGEIARRRGRVRNAGTHSSGVWPKWTDKYIYLFIEADERTGRPYMRSTDSQCQPYWQSTTYTLRSNLSHFTVLNGPFHRAIWVILGDEMADIELR